ncbi:MAG: 4Fe-4S binding protein, partial [Gemmatimonadales bacterium]
MSREAQAKESIFDLPSRKWFVPDPVYDFSAQHFDRRAATPVGPAAGPHTQLAQNIVLAWLAGSRIIELKTVQVDDQLDIPRPCIHVPNVGYNVEWSQELRVEQSAVEYTKAAYLIEILKSTRAFGLIPESENLDRHWDTVFDISIGYDLDGIRSEKVTGFLQTMRDSGRVFDELRSELDNDLKQFRDLELPLTVSGCVTLSTFHGCPADQIEAIGRYLLDDLGLHTIIKLNPTLLGFERVGELLHRRLGYTHIELSREAFDVDLQYDSGLAILRNLQDVAQTRGSTIGAKFTNTLVVKNNADVFPTQSDPYMYLSGKPLHVISMNLMQQFREDLGFDFPVSFSAGIDSKNFPTAVGCGLVPVTTCTDLLRQGGYGRLAGYFKTLAKEMARVGVTSREALVLAMCGRGTAAAGESVSRLAGKDVWERNAAHLEVVARDDPQLLPRELRALATSVQIDPDALVLDATRVAGRLNGRDLVPPLMEDKRYHAGANSKSPRQIDSQLALYDCINCDLCIAACPNDAIFT